VHSLNSSIKMSNICTSSGTITKSNTKLQLTHHFCSNDDTGTGLQLQIGGRTEVKSSTFLSDADTERLESQSRKIQLQQLYAKQLSDDASLNSGRDLELGSVGGRKSVDKGRSVSNGYLGRENNDTRKSRGVGEVGGGAGGGMFESMSEREQAFIAAAKKRAAQQEYYQQFEDQAADSRSAQNLIPRVSLYQNREQKDRNLTENKQRDSERSAAYRQQRAQGLQHDSDRHQEVSFGLSAGPGNRLVSVSEREVSSRRKQQLEYSEALKSDSKAIPIADSYMAQRRLHHERKRVQSGVGIDNTVNCGHEPSTYTQGASGGSDYPRRGSNPPLGEYNYPPEGSVGSNYRSGGYQEEEKYEFGEDGPGYRGRVIEKGYEDKGGQALNLYRSRDSSERGGERGGYTNDRIPMTGRKHDQGGYTDNDSTYQSRKGIVGGSGGTYYQQSLPTRSPYMDTDRGHYEPQSPQQSSQQLPQQSPGQHYKKEHLFGTNTNIIMSQPQRGAYPDDNSEPNIKGKGMLQEN
jgi:hypothetical protein